MTSARGQSRTVRLCRSRRWSVVSAAALSLSACAAARPGDATTPGARQLVTRVSVQATAAPTDHFTGRVRVVRLSPAGDDINAATAYVTFEPGARSAWHVHPRGQYLAVTAGEGLTQQWGQAAQRIRPGDLVWCPPGVKHWHGAVLTTSMTHLAVTGTADGKSVRWMEEVNDTTYGAAATLGNAREGREPKPAQLSARQQAISLIAACMATSDLPGLREALHEGLDAGLTISEAKEVLVQLYAYAGFPRSLNALAELMQVVDARKQLGIKDAPGREPGRAVPVGEALVAVGTANQTQISGGPVGGPVFDFAPVINRFLQTHLFGDIFARDNLDWPSRELATLGALAATPGVEPQLRSHMAAGLRVGLTVEQLRHLAEVLTARVDAAAGERARAALTQALTR